MSRSVNGSKGLGDERQATLLICAGTTAGLQSHSLLDTVPAEGSPKMFRSRISLDKAARSRAFQRSACITAALAFILATGQIAVAGTPTALISTKRVSEYQPSFATGYLVWDQNSIAHPRIFNSFAKPTGQPRIRVNPAGTHSNGAAIDGTTVLYQEVSRRGSNLKLYDVNTGDRTGPGSGVNSRFWEYEPGISADHLFFSRGKFGGSSPWVRLILYDRPTGQSQVLAEADPRHRYLISNQVNGDWAVWESCRVREGNFTNCNVFRYQISTAETARVPNPNRQQYGSAVTSDGTLYYVRTGRADAWECGAGARLVRYPVGGPATVIASLPQGKDAFSMFAFEEADTSITLYFDRIACRRGQSGDIYDLTNADTA
jgi:hypothetical protein